MKKLFIAILALAAIAFPASSSAQPWSAASRLSIDIPTGRLAEVASPGFGYGGMFGYDISPTVMLSASFMNNNFGVESESFDIAHFEIDGRFIPGGRGDTSSTELTPFVGMGIGVYFIMGGIELSGSTDHKSRGDVVLGLAPSAGIMIPIPAIKGSIVPTLKYHAMLTDNETTYFLGFNVGIEASF